MAAPHSQTDEHLRRRATFRDRVHGVNVITISSITPAERRSSGRTTIVCP